MSIKILVISVAIFLVLAISCSPEKKTESSLEQSEDISLVFENYWEERSKLFPLEATEQGDNRYNDILVNDQTQFHRDSLRNLYHRYFDQISTFNRDSLNYNDQLSFDIFKYEMQLQLEGLETNLWMIPFQQFVGLPLTMPQLGSGKSFQPFNTPEDYRNWLSRVDGFSIWVDTAIANFRKGMKDGVVLPKALVEKMIPQMEAIVVTDPMESLFYLPVRNFPDRFTDEEKNSLAELYRGAIKRKINPAYTKLANFLSGEYLPKARNSSGIVSIPKGAETYKYLVKSWTTTNQSPDEIHQIGLAEVKRIREKMDSLKMEINFVGGLKQFFHYMETDSRFTPFKSPQDILNAFKGIHKKIEPKLKTMFERVPKNPFVIRQTEAFRAASASAEYKPGLPDGSRPGIFYVPILDAQKFNLAGMESLFLHEAIPGHHYQVALQSENQDLPAFRRFAWYGAFGEGWALYAESLGKELGLYSDPYQYMGALGDEMHRAIRLVVDVAIHTNTMTREEAIDYMMENEIISKEAATAEVERYMAIPGQALSYKIGSLKITALRKELKERLGGDFKLTNFHTDILQDGVMPLGVLENKMLNSSPK